MDITSFFSTIFISSAFISVTIFSIITGFGPQSKELRDPFQENEDQMKQRKESKITFIKNKI